MADEERAPLRVERAVGRDVGAERQLDPEHRRPIEQPPDRRRRRRHAGVRPEDPHARIRDEHLLDRRLVDMALQEQVARFRQLGDAPHRGRHEDSERHGGDGSIHAIGPYSRRQVLRALGGGAALVASRHVPAWAQSSDPILAGRPLVRYPQKTDLILLTSRPPQLETPMKWFERAITPNEAFFVGYQMDGAPLPMLNGFPARLVVPGWYATYWVKNLSDITVADKPFERFWMKPAYRIPDNPCGCVEPGTAPKATVPIHRMNVRSFLVSPEPGARLAAGRPVTLKGIAFDGGYGIREVEVSDDGGSTWRRVSLGRDLGPYAFREWSAAWTPPRAGAARVMVRAFNRIGESQGTEPLWNPAGYLRNVIESVEYPVG